MSELALTTSRRIAAPPDRLYAAWLDPAMLARFMLAGPGMTIPHAETDPRVGGRFAVTMSMDGRDLPHAGTYLDLQPNRRIVFTWESPFSVPDSTVTVTFEPRDGGTEVTLTHVKFASEQSRDNHRGGWNAILDALAREAGTSQAHGAEREHASQ
jgi:uncharacterized protein YndB with AHSA1/START domain